MVRRIAIVGAGVAGLAAARRLVDEGREVQLFEKARRPGGRISTRREETRAFDHGAQYFTCREAAFSRRVADWCERGVVARWDAPIVVLSSGQCRETSGTTERYVGVPGMSALARDLSSGLPVECGRRIERVEGSPGTWRLVCDDGENFEGFDALLVATPSPQALPLLRSVPELAQRVSAVAMQACHTLMLGFAAPLGVDFGGAFVEDSPLSWVARNNSKPGRGDPECWVLQTTPEWSAAHLEDPQERVADTLLAALRAALGRDELEPTSRSVHRWRYARSAEALGEACVWDADARVGVCGDWTLGGRIEGAFCSGEQLGEAVCTG